MLTHFRGSKHWLISIIHCKLLECDIKMMIIFMNVVRELIWDNCLLYLHWCITRNPQTSVRNGTIAKSKKNIRNDSQFFAVKATAYVCSFEHCIKGLCLRRAQRLVCIIRISSRVLDGHLYNREFNPFRRQTKWTLNILFVLVC